MTQLFGLSFFNEGTEVCLHVSSYYDMTILLLYCYYVTSMLLTLLHQCCYHGLINITSLQYQHCQDQHTKQEYESLNLCVSVRCWSFSNNTWWLNVLGSAWMRSSSPCFLARSWSKHHKNNKARVNLTHYITEKTYTEESTQDDILSSSLFCKAVNVLW